MDEMEATAVRKSPTTPVQVGWKAEDVLTDLEAALGDHGIVLPSLQIERVGYCNPDERNQLIELGRANLETAVKLVSALTPAVETRN